jgi:hypothetical protein
VVVNFFVILAPGVFDLGRPFQPTVMFLGKASGLCHKTYYSRYLRFL